MLLNSDRMFLGGLSDDTVAGLRRMRRRLLETSTHVVLTAIGIAAAGSILGLIYGLFLRPLGFPDSSRLVAMYGVERSQQSNPGAEARWNRRRLPWASWHALNSSSQDLVVTGVWAPSRPVIGLPAEDVIETWHVSSSLLRLLGATPIRGRVFTSDEDKRAVSDGALISWESWQQRFNGREDIIGTRIVVSFFTGELIPKTVVGVLSPGVKLAGNVPELFLPIGERSAWASRRDGTLYVIGRVAQGASMASVDLALRGAVTSTDPGTDIETRVVPLREDLMGSDAASSTLIALVGAIVLLIALAGVGALSLLDAEARRSELATRLALGATPRKLAQAYGLEQLIKCALASAMGMTMTVGLSGVLSARLNGHLFNLSVQSFVVCGAVAVGIMFLAMGLAPASVLLDPRYARRSGTYWSSGVRTAHNVTAVCQVSILLVLLVCTGWLTTSLSELASRPLGFDPSRLIVANVRHTAAPRVRHVAGQIPAFSSWLHIEALLDRLRQLPGVTKAAGSSAVPFNSSGQPMQVRSTDESSTAFDAQLVMITEQYFDTLGVGILAGRALASADRLSTPFQTEIAVVVSEDIAKRAGGLGARMAELNSTLVYKVVGVTRSIKQRRVTDERDLSVYALSPTHDGITNIVARVVNDDASNIASVGEAVRAFDSTIVISAISTVEQALSDSLTVQRVRRDLFVACSLVATLMASLGVCLVGFRIVNERRRELGIRMTLGATPLNVAGVILRHQAKLLSISLAIGAPAAMVAVRWLSDAMVDARASVLGAVVLSVCVLAVVGIVAVLAPLLKITRLGLPVLLRE